MNLFELSVKIGADTSQAEKGMKRTQGVSETLTNKIKVMSAQFEAAQKNVDKLTKEFNESVNKAGATDKATQELAKKLAEAEKEAGKFAKELNEVQKEAEQADSALDDCNEEIKDTGEKAEKSGNGLANFAGKLGKGLATAAKIGAAAVGAAAAGITALTTAAVNNYAEYEQLVGGVDTLFKTSSQKVQEYAANAYKTAGMSANEYMSTVTSFSASLLKSLGGDTDKAAEYANQALTDMSDNANKMGTSMELIQNAYQGFAKQNYTMLDNLKLGYGGTKDEMKRLIKDASKLDKSIKANDLSFGNIVKAINVVQTEMGITGTTALESGRTISGSVGAMKSAWTNLLTGLADGNADVGELVNNLVTTIVGDGSEENLGVFGNIMPAVQTALTGASTLISELLPQIVQIIPTIITENLPILAEAAISIIQSLVDGISQNQEMLMKTAFDTIVFLANSLISMLPQIVQLGLDLIVSLANGIAESLPTLIPTVMAVIMQIVHILTDPANLTNLLNAALIIITELAYGLMDAIPQLVQAVSDIIINIADFLVDPVNLANILKVAVDIVIALAVGLVDAIPVLLKHLPKLWLSIIDNFRNVDWGQLGKNLVDGFKNGISRAWTSLKTWFKNLFGDLIGIAKKILGIASPSKVFKKIGGFTAEGFGVGFEDEFAHVKDDMKKALTFEEASIGINASIKRTGAGQGAFGSNAGGVSIVQNIYSEAKTAADLMQEALYHQERAVLLGV